MGNVIHRKTTWMKVKKVVQHIDTFPNEFVVEKDDCNRWIGTDSEGKRWGFFIAQLRNENFFTILEQR